MPAFLLDSRFRAHLSSAFWLLAGALVLAAGWWLWHFQTEPGRHSSHFVELTEAEALPSASDAPPNAWDDSVRVSLPHRWAQTQRDMTGSLWYRMTVPLPKSPQGTWAVYLPKFNMNAEVWVNGVSLGRVGSMTPPLTYHWYTPLIFAVPPNAWKASGNVIDVRVSSGSLHRAGLAPVWVGPFGELNAVYTQRWWVQVAGVHAVNGGLVMLGLLLIVMWWRDRSQSAFGFVGQAAIFWGLSTSANIVPDPFLPIPVWDGLTFIGIVWGQLSLCLFFFRFANRHWPRLERVIIAFAILDPLVVLAGALQILVGLTYLAIYALAVVGFALGIWHAYRTHRPDRHLFAIGCLAAIPAAAHDVALQLNQFSFDSVYLLPYGGPVLVACMAFIVAGDHARARQALEQLNRDLLASIHRREAELRESFQRVSALEQDQAVSAERARILRDMHDGVGAHLTTALRQLNPAPTTQTVDMRMVTRILREALDQLKLSIDAMSMPPGDVVGLLASLRFRMTPRFKAAGVALRWDVADLPPWPGGTQPALRQLQYILFEAMSNVLQHAGAQAITLSARIEGEQLLLVLHDDGQGAGVDAQPEGHGSQTMRSRAGTIGAEIEFVSPPEGGYAVRLSLPMGGTQDGQ